MSSISPPSTTIAAIATAPGRGGIGIVRLSGPKARHIGEQISQRQLEARKVQFTRFYDTDGNLIDEGLLLYFAAPNSFTGEDCLELQGHGGPVVLDWLLQTTLKHGALLAQPGEFSQRAFLNDKLDLSQAEAIADLIDASSRQSARNALNSLQGEFSRRIHDLVEALIQLRIYVEVAIDFPEEEIDFLSDGKVAKQLTEVIARLALLRKESQQGVLMREGIRVVIAGKPNAGKSSLMNALAQRETAIVTNIAGTTRDILREYIQLDGLPLHLIDTAGLRDNPDEVERIGIERAQQEFVKADRVLLVVDSQECSDDPQQLSIEQLWPNSVGAQPEPEKITVIFNKIDESGWQQGLGEINLPQAKATSTLKTLPCIRVSATTGAGLEDLKQHLKQIAGFSENNEGSFTARRRHLDALERAAEALLHGQQQLLVNRAGELLAEDLRLAQNFLGEITGEISPDALLGRIFSSFCIGK